MHHGDYCRIDLNAACDLFWKDGVIGSMYFEPARITSFAIAVITIAVVVITVKGSVEPGDIARSHTVVTQHMGAQ